MRQTVRLPGADSSSTAKICQRPAAKLPVKPLDQTVFDAAWKFPRIPPPNLKTVPGREQIVDDGTAVSVKVLAEP